jgi:hypothetical protein
MKETAKITLGPIFTPVNAALHPRSQIVPLNLVMEWANPARAWRLPLFRRQPPNGADRIRLEHIVFRRGELPCHIECPAYQVAHAPDGEYLPLDALLGKMLQTRLITRPVFRLLNDLASAVPLDNSITRPITAKGLLASNLEMQGFRLNTAFEHAGQICAQIGWEPECRPTRFHSCAAAFNRKPGKNLDTGYWLDCPEMGVARALAEEFHRLLAGAPIQLFSEAGIHYLENCIPARAAAIGCQYYNNAKHKA